MRNSARGARGARGARIGLVPLCFFFSGGLGPWEVGKWHLKLFLLGGKVWLDGGLRVEECHRVISCPHPAVLAGMHGRAKKVPKSVKMESYVQ